MPSRRYRVRFTCLAPHTKTRPSAFETATTFEAESDTGLLPHAAIAVRDALRRQGINPVLAKYVIDTDSLTPVESE